MRSPNRRRPWSESDAHQRHGGIGGGTHPHGSGGPEDLPGANSENPAEQLAWRRLTAQHGDRLHQIMDEYGWPTAELVGEDAARGAWLIAQHADRQLDVQRRALRLMEQAVAAGSAAPRELAFLRDRTLVNEGRKQIYGTQIMRHQGGFSGPVAL